MIFLSPWFFIFIATTVCLCWLSPNLRIRQMLILAASACFYFHFAGANFAGVLPLLILGIITYLCGISRNKVCCVLGITICVGALIFYKYTLFLSQSILSLIPGMLLPELILDSLNSIALPLGISFFVFEFVHYLVDVMRGEFSIKNPFQFSLFILFFPSLVAGPIKRYEQFLPQLQTLATGLAGTDLVYGSLRVASGLIKKIAADNLTIYVDYWDDQFGEIGLQWRWLLLVLMALRIYWDFSGYSDMAIGYAHWLGIQLPENFNFPYLATNITDFWRRWHISLSTWIRDYIYIPLGGSRCGITRKILNGLIAFGLCGLWHGAGWNFALWGLYHGIGLAISSNYKTFLGALGRDIHAVLDRVPAFCWGVTLLYVCIGWLLFFYPLPQAWKMAQLLVGIS